MKHEKEICVVRNEGAVYLFLIREEGAAMVPYSVSDG